MNTILDDTTTILSVVCALITAIMAVVTIKDYRREKANDKASDVQHKFSADEYEDILKATQELEFNREKNKGLHFEDESVYLNRANQIRVNSPFFSWLRQPQS